MTRRTRGEIQEPAVDPEPESDTLRQHWPAWCLLAGAVLFAGLTLFQFRQIQQQFRLIQQQSEALRAGQRERLFWMVCQPSTPARERTDSFLQLVKLGQQEWRSAALHELQLQGSDLAGADLRFTNLAASDLTRANLTGALLNDSSLRLVDLTEADLSDSLLDGADLLKATLTKADFRKARMRRCSLEQANAVDAVFILADLAEARLVMTDFSRATLTGADLTGANMEWARLIGTDLTLTKLAEVRLENADLTNSNWWRARGLSEDQLDDLIQRCPPNDAAEASRREDYALWLQSRASGAPAIPPENGK